MIKHIFITLLLMSVLASCQQGNLELLHKDSGELNIQLMDSNGQPIADGLVLLSSETTIDNEHDDYRAGYDPDEEDERQKPDNILQELRSAANGQLNFGRIIKGNYTIHGVDVKDGENAYSFIKVVQVVASETSDVIVVPSVYSASIELHLKERQLDETDLPMGADVKIALCKNMNFYERRRSELTFEELMANKVREVQGDGVKETFLFEKVPLNAYYVVAYTDARHYRAVNTYEQFRKDEVVPFHYVYAAPQIRKYEFDQAFMIGTDLSPKEGCKIHLLYYSDYMQLTNKEDFDAVSALSFTSASTDAKGMATIKTPGFQELMVVVFNADNTFLSKKGFEYQENVTWQYTSHWQQK